jgi:HD superfamily phosphohydrolase
MGKMKTKVIRDSIHGYIEIDAKIFRNIIDTPEFQRLRRIEQTSMRCLYPAARHDRFIHSIGVYHLSTIATKSIIDSIQYLWGNESKGDKKSTAKKVINEVTNIGHNFEVACLLHDVGHSPLSHTLEDFFKLKQKKYKGEIIPAINAELFSSIEKVIGKDNVSSFREQFDEFKPSAHEIISGIILLKVFQDKIKRLFDECFGDTDATVDIEFMARAIMGIVYPEDHTCRHAIKNGFIRLLNSNSIDVDKLDYIVRDSQVSGFDNVVVDIERLLKAIRIVPTDKKHIDIEKVVMAFDRTAISVLQNVVSSRNSLYTWVYGHPKVVYETKLFQRAVEKISGKKAGEASGATTTKEEKDRYICELFSTKNIINNLLCDDDIWVIMKEFRNSIPEITEIMDRSKQKIAVWKGYAAYNAYFGSNKATSSSDDFNPDMFVTIVGAKNTDGTNKILAYLKKYPPSPNIKFDVIAPEIKFSQLDGDSTKVIINNKIYEYSVALTGDMGVAVLPVKKLRYVYLYCSEKDRLSLQETGIDAFIQYVKEYQGFKTAS